MANFVVVSEDRESAHLMADMACFECGVQHTVTVKTSALDALNSGNIQDVLPNHTPEDREILQSGQCNKSFNKLFPPDEDI